jgi:hypothetical protein
MQKPKRKNGDVSRASSFPSPKPHGPGRKRIQHRRVHVFGELSLACRVHAHKIISTQPRKTEHRTRLQLCTSQWCQKSENEGMPPSAQNSGPKMSLDDHVGNSFQHHSKGLETSGPKQHLQPLPAQTCFKAHRSSHQGQAGVTQITMH